MSQEGQTPGAQGKEAERQLRPGSRFDAPSIATASLITVLFADVVSSTVQIADLDIEEAQELLDQAVARMRQRVRQFGGTVARVQGDGVMAIFGAPSAYEDHALRACCAGQAICDDFSALPGAGTGGFNGVRVGIHSGRALIRALKSGRVDDYDAVGPDVNFTAKVERDAPSNRVLLTGETLALAGPMVAADARGQLTVAPQRTLSLYELRGINFDRNLTHVLDSDHESPLIGREATLEHVLGMIDAKSPSGTSIALIGEAGIGKTRLSHEVARTVRALGLRVEELAGISVLRRTPFSSLRSFVRNLLGCSPAAAGEDLHRAAASHQVPPGLRAGLVETAGATIEDRDWSALTAQARRETMLAAIADLVERTARHQPLLILVEDVHHLDAETADLLVVLHRLTARLPVWLLLTARAPAREEAARAANEIIDLAPLAVEEAKEFCRFFSAPGAPRDHGLVDRLVQRAAGNPFFLQELLRMPAAEHKDADATPLSIGSLVQSRMAGLSPAARRVMLGAGILGAEIERPILAATSEVEESELDAILGELEAQHLIDASSRDKVRFRHELFRGGALMTLLRAEAVEIHARAAAAFEKQTNASAATLERLAYHAERSGQIEKALKQLVTACQLGVRTSSQKTIRALYDWAMRMKPSLPEPAKGPLLDLVMTSLDALQQSGDAEEYERAMLLAIELCEARGERLREGIVRAHYSVFNWIWSRHDVAGVNADIALKVAKETGFFALRDSAQSMTAHILHGVGRLDDAIETYIDLINLYSPEDERSTFGRMFFPSVRSCAFLASFLLDRGRIADAKSYIERGERILGDIDQPYSRVLITNAHGRLALATGDAEKAVALLEKTLDACIKGQIYLVEPSAAGELATALVRVGRPEQAREIARPIIEQKRYLRSGRYAAVRVFRGLAEAELACGNGAAALATIDEGLLMAIENKEPIHVAQTRYVRGLALIATGDRAGGIADIETALKAARELHLDPLAADCQETLSNVTGARGASAPRLRRP